MWRRALSDPGGPDGTLVAEGDGGRVVGFTSFGPTRDEDASPGTGEVFTIYVEPEVLGTGIGRKLFREAAARLRDAGFERATLWVLATNDRSRGFYEKVGWRFDGTESTHEEQCLNMPIVRYAADLA